MKNIYQKLQQARVTLQSLPIKKSGFNSFAKYNYFELGDFLPSLNKINNELGLLCQFSHTESGYSLLVVNSDNPEEKIIFTSRHVEAGIKGAQAIQNLGGEITYQRRYLYTLAFEVVEGDAIDAQKQFYFMPSERLKAMSLHLLSLDTEEEINKLYTDVERQAGGLDLDDSIKDVFVTATEKLKKQLEEV